MIALERIALLWADWALAAGGQLALLAAVAALALAFARRMPSRFRCAIWTVVLLKMFLPPAWGPAWGVGAWGMKPLARRAADSFPALSAAAGAIQSPAPPSSSDPSPSPASGSAPVSADQSAATPSATAILFLIWAAGVVASVSLTAWRAIWLARRVRNAEEATEGAIKIEAERLALLLGRESAPQVLLSREIGSPLLCGLLRPRIVLPVPLAHTLAFEDVRHILLHELIHWRRRDLWVAWLQAAGQALYWFHPAAWFANARLRHERECACDEAAVALLGGAATGYAESIVNALLASQGRSPIAAGFLGIFEQDTRLQRRIENVMERKHRTRPAAEMAVIVLFAAVFLPMAGCKSGLSAEPGPSSAQSAHFNRFVRLVVGAESMTLEGDLVDWAELRERLERVESRERAVFEVAFAPDFEATQTAAQARQARFTAFQVGHELGFGSLSDVGVHALGAKGGEPPALDGREVAQAAAPAAAKPDPGNPNSPPQIVAINPVPGSAEVDPALAEIAVTFNRDMGGGMSWTGGGEIFPPIPQGQKPHWKDARTCVLPVKLAPGKYYRVGINSTGFLNFRSAKGIPVDPAVIYFTTKGADAATKMKLARPSIAKLSPANGADGVAASTAELRVAFTVPMGGGMSWTGGGDAFPESPEGAKCSWSEDMKTCVFPVKLKPDWTYHLGINSPSFNNFQSEWGVPVLPVQYTFKTGK